MTVAPRDRGRRSASRQKENAILTSVSQLVENSSQVSSWIGRPGGMAPAHSTNRSGRRAAKTLAGAAAAAASMANVFIPGRCLANCSRGAGFLPTARTCAPSAAVLRAMARPTPREAPTITTFLPVRVTIVDSHCCKRRDEEGIDTYETASESENHRSAQKSPKVTGVQG